MNWYSFNLMIFMRNIVVRTCFAATTTFPLLDLEQSEIHSNTDTVIFLMVGPLRRIPFLFEPAEDNLFIFNHYPSRFRVRRYT
jgi:hypothetical protein